MFPAEISRNATATQLNQNARSYRPDSVKNVRPSTVGVNNHSNRTFNRLDALGGPPASPTENYRPQVPAHVIYDKQVLRFYGQFLEVCPWEVDGPLGTPTIENEIVRNVTISYFLQDDTVSIEEGAGNNGMKGDIMSEREIHVLKLVAEGLSNKEIGERLHLASSTVRDYLQSVMRKLDVTSRTGAAISALRQGLLTN